jgi:hypothetical protein
MLYVILLLILAVLLFGSSAVIGAMGVMLGFIAAAVAIVWASIAFGISGEGWAMIVLVGVILLAIAHYSLEAKAKADKERMKAEVEAKYRVNLSPAKRKESEAIISAGRRSRAVMESRKAKGG